jgi:hypothetical protein
MLTTALTPTALPHYAAHYYSPGGEPEAFSPGCRVQLPAAPLVVRVESGCRLLENIQMPVLWTVLRIRDVHPGSRILDPNLSIPDPGSKRFRFPDTHPHQRI